MTNTSVSRKPTFTTWRTITLGEHPSNGPALDLTLRNMRIEVSGVTSLVTRVAYQFSEEVVEVDLVKVTLGELGLDNAMPYEVNKRATELGLKVCLSEVGPKLRMQYMNQPNGEVLYIGMDTIPDWDADCVFTVQRSEQKLYLGIICHDHRLKKDDIVIFVKPRK